MTTPIVINPRDMSWWAETVDGLKEEDDVYLVELPTKLQLRRKGEAPLPGEKKIIGIIPRSGPRPRKPALVCKVNSVDYPLPQKEGMDCDALFVTASAAAKFVYPYYEAHRLLTDDEMVKLKRCFSSPPADLIGIAHYPPSRPFQVKEGGLEQIGSYPLETTFVLTAVKGAEGGATMTPLSTFAKDLK